jgi:hypothetical protein
MTEFNSTIQPLTEHVTDWRAGDVQVDFAQRLVANVVLSGGVSRNGHRYTAEALRQAAPLYDRKPVFLDHAPNPSRPFERSMRDLVGAVQNPRFVDGRIRGDIQVLDTEAGRTFLALVDAEHPTVGMSHVVLAQRGGDLHVVERIHEVVSVDAVVFPATTHGLREGGAATLPGSWEAFLEQFDAALAAHWRTTHGDDAAVPQRVALFAESVLLEVDDRSTGVTPQRLAWTPTVNGPVFSESFTPSEASAQPSLWAALAELPVLRERVQAYESERRQHDLREQVAQELAAAALPDFAVTPAFREQLLQLDEAAARQRLIAERVELTRRCRPQPPGSQPRSGRATAVDDAFRRALRGERGPVLCGWG